MFGAAYYINISVIDTHIRAWRIKMLNEPRSLSKPKLPACTRVKSEIRKRLFNYITIECMELASYCDIHI